MDPLVLMSEAVQNVLFIMTDQQRQDSLGCYGNPYTATPNLDALAKRGCRFDRHYVANPICMPSRLSIMSGRMPSNHGLWTNGLLLEEQPTMASWFAQRNVRTAAIGKIHHTPYGGEADNIESKKLWEERGDDTSWTGPYWGFEHVELCLEHIVASAHYGRWFRENGGTEEMLQKDSETGTRSIPARLHDSTFVGERSSEYLRQRAADGERFFLCASFPDPHHPFDPPAEVADRYDPEQAPDSVGGPADLETRPEHYRQQFEGRWNRAGVREGGNHPDGIDRKTAQRRIANTAAMVDLIDQNVGRILQTLEETGLADNTLVVFTSDHGELLGDHGLWLKGPFFYEGLIKTPLLIAGPGVSPSGGVSKLSSAIDLSATLCEAMGCGIPPWSEGVSLWPLLRGESDTVRDSCLIEYRNGFDEKDVASRTLVTEQWKYTRYETGEEELTDLHNDPAETTNRASDAAHRAEVQRMREQLLDASLSAKNRLPEQISPF